MLKFARKFIPLLLLTFFLVVTIQFFSTTLTAETEDLDTRVKKFLDTHDYSLPNLETTVDDRGAGLSISYKKSQ